MSKFDYNAPAELFPSRNRKIANKVKYRRFDRAAEAIRFAVEELPEPQLLGAFIEINEERLSQGHPGAVRKRELSAREEGALNRRRRRFDRLRQIAYGRRVETIVFGFALLRCPGIGR